MCVKQKEGANLCNLAECKLTQREHKCVSPVPFITGIDTFPITILEVGSTFDSLVQEESNGRKQKERNRYRKM